MFGFIFCLKKSINISAILFFWGDWPVEINKNLDILDYLGELL